MQEASQSLTNAEANVFRDKGKKLLEMIGREGLFKIKVTANTKPGRDCYIVARVWETQDVLELRA